MSTIANREFLNSGCIEKSRTLKIVRIRILHVNLARRKLLCGAIYNGIIYTRRHMNVNGQNFHMALFVMRREGIPTFTPVNKTHSLKGAGFFYYTVQGGSSLVWMTI